MTELICRNSSTEIQAAAAEIDLSGAAFMFMPGGKNVINCKQGSKSVEVEVLVDKKTAATMQGQLEAVRSRSAHKPFFDFDHEDKTASFWPAEFFWSDLPKPGVYVRGEWSKQGLEAVKGKAYRAFSPVFHVDDPKGKPARVVANPDARLNFGGLVNDPAFREILPLAAKRAGASQQQQNTDKMTANEMAELQAKIQQLEQEIEGLIATADNSPESAEVLTAKRAELNSAKAELESEKLRAKNAQLEASFIAQRTKDAKEAVQRAIKRGALPPKDEASHALWAKKCVEDPENIQLLDGLKGSAALAAAQPDRRIVLGNMGVIRESTENVLKTMASIYAKQMTPDANHEARRGFARESAAMYAKEILPRLKEGDDIPLSGANSLGTLAQTLVATRTLELLTLSFPILKMVYTDFSDQIVSYGDTLNTRTVGIPTVQTFNTTTGWPTNSDVTTTDVAITYNQFKGVPVIFMAHHIAGTVRRLFDEIAPAQAYALGKDIVDYVYALITSAYNVNAITVAVSSAFNREVVSELGGVLDDAGNPDTGRYLVLARPYYTVLENDPTLNQLAAFQRADFITQGMEASTLQNVSGFRIIKAPNLPATVIGAKVLQGFAASKSAIVLASRLSADYVNAVPGSNNGSLTVVTTPGGFSANVVNFVSHTGGYAAQRMEVIYGASRGQLRAGALLTN
jgi:hypothetical protein